MLESWATIQKVLVTEKSTQVELKYEVVIRALITAAIFWRNS